MALKETVEVPSLRCDSRLIRQFVQFFNLTIIRLASGKINGQRLQFDPEVEDLLRILQRECLDVCSRKRRPLNETVVLQLDQCFADQPLANPELLSDLRFDDLFSTPDRAGNNGLPQ